MTLGPPALRGPEVPEPGASLGPQALRGGRRAPTAPPGQRSAHREKPLLISHTELPSGHTPDGPGLHRHPRRLVSSLTPPSRRPPGGGKRQAGQGLWATTPLRVRRAHGQTARTTGRWGPPRLAAHGTPEPETDPARQLPSSQENRRSTRPHLSARRGLHI